jgi:transposase-like protein
MNKDSTTSAVADGLFAGDAWFDPIEAGLRGRIRGFIEAMLEEELTAALGGGRYDRAPQRASSRQARPPAAWLIRADDDQCATGTADQA